MDHENKDMQQPVAKIFIYLNEGTSSSMKDAYNNRQKQ